ncbi:transposase [Cellulosimicrobium cellulans J34]|nr:transposase [Cellulosimicrobium cellulans J34]SMF03082.1 Transposase and inactivated derivatives [Cellulosimicrobium cellulans J1]
MTAVIDAVARGVPAALSELITLGRTLKKRAADVLAFFDLPGTSNGPTEATNGRLKHLRGSALGFRNPAPLQRPITPGSRRLQTPTSPSDRMSL